MSDRPIARLLLGALLLSGCAPEAGPPEGERGAGSGQAAGIEIEYEPAYPEDVSGEPLSDDDVAQQETHRHGDEETHEHEEGESDHEHEDEADPPR